MEDYISSMDFKKTPSNTHCQQLDFYKLKHFFQKKKRKLDSKKRKRMGNSLFHGSIEYKIGNNKIILRKNESVRNTTFPLLLIIFEYFYYLTLIILFIILLE